MPRRVDAGNPADRIAAELASARVDCNIQQSPVGFAPALHPLPTTWPNSNWISPT
jgi:hypothetical protein